MQKLLHLTHCKLLSRDTRCVTFNTNACNLPRDIITTAPGAPRECSENCRANEYISTCRGYLIRMQEQYPSLAYLDARARARAPHLAPFPSSPRRTREIAAVYIFSPTVHATVHQANALDKQELINHTEFADCRCVFTIPPQNVNWR